MSGRFWETKEVRENVFPNYVNTQSIKTMTKQTTVCALGRMQYSANLEQSVAVLESTESYKDIPE